LAWANVSVGHTNLTIHVKGSSVTGKLVGKPECRPNQTIELWIDGVSQTTTTTDGAGNYAFTWPLSAGNTVQTFFGGSQTGLHPNRFVCTPALSRLVVIRDHPSEKSVAASNAPFTAHGRTAIPRVAVLARMRFPFVI
jgi:hypothetical protein